MTVTESIDQATSKKNDLILDASTPEQHMEVAELEETIASGYLTLGKDEDAVVNMVSAASCYSKAGNQFLARKTLLQAKALTKKKGVVEMIDSELSKI